MNDTHKHMLKLKSKWNVKKSRNLVVDLLDVAESKLQFVPFTLLLL